MWAFDEAAKESAGWPVVLPNSSVPTLRFVNGDLYGAAERPDTGRWRLLLISPDGAVRNGPAFVVYRADIAVGPDGTVYAVKDSEDGSDIIAVTMGGPRDGWPVHVTGWSSIPSFGPDGRVYVVVDELDGLYGKKTNSSSRVLALSRDGRTIPGWPARIPIDTLTGGPEGVVYPDPPVVVPDGSVYIVVGPGTYALDPTGQMRTGWPYESTATFVTEIVGVGTCPSGCGSMCAIPDVNSPPLASPDGTLHLAQNTKGDVYAGANRIVAVGANGDVMAGWPVTLVEKSALVRHVRGRRRRVGLRVRPRACWDRAQPMRREEPSLLRDRRGLRRARRPDLHDHARRAVGRAREPHNNRCLRRSALRAKEPRPYPA